MKRENKVREHRENPLFYGKWHLLSVRKQKSPQNPRKLPSKVHN